MTPRTGNPSAGGWLRPIIAEAGGWISVERFMREALFHPQHGYYSARASGVGRDGDFSTSATLHPALGQAVAAWAWAHRREVGARWGGRWDLVELGGGSGQLAESLLRALGWWGRRGLRLHVVEVSGALRAAQARRLRRWAGRLVHWHADAAGALSAAGGRALVFSNEFVDAFPCRQWQRRTGAWQEVGIVWPEDAPGPTEETRGRPMPGEACGALDPGLFPDPPEGQRVEAHLAYREWLGQGLAPHWRAGRMLTIDYGADVPAALFHRRRGGTLRAYFRHQRLEGPGEFYARPGRQDLTADVNFSDLRRWGQEFGLTEGEPAVQSQREFLLRWLPGAARAARTDPALAFLLDPDGAGGAFQVLEQRAAG